MLRKLYSTLFSTLHQARCRQMVPQRPGCCREIGIYMEQYTLNVCDSPELQFNKNLKTRQVGINTGRLGLKVI